jgi:hypothetical protein
METLLWGFMGNSECTQFGHAIPLLQTGGENFNPVVFVCGMKLYVSLYHL